MPLKSVILLSLTFTIMSLSGCSSGGGGGSSGGSSQTFFQYSIDGGPLQRLEITDTSNADIDSYYSTADNETVVSVPLEWDGATYLKIFEFRYPGSGTGAQSVTQASYWFNDGLDTTYSHVPTTATSAMLTITAYGQIAQPIAGEFDFTLCVDTATCAMSISLTGSFAILRNVDR